MRRFESIFFAAMMATATWGQALGGDLNCDSEIYRKYNPDKCIDNFNQSGFSFATGGIASGGAIALVGGTIALLAGNDSGTDSHDKPTVQMPVQPALKQYTLVGGDVESVQLAAIMQDDEYQRNTNQYNDIRLAYSLARGYTGQGSVIAILDSGENDYHGGNVAYLAGGAIAPNADVKSYLVTETPEIFKPFDEIGDVIGHATNDGANIYNFSWVATNASATSIRNRQHITNLTSANFINAITNAAAANDAIFVWAAGNDGDSQSSALSALPLHIPELNGHFVNVVAWDSATEQLAYFSNQCGITKNYCITAPGTHIDSPVAEGTLNGTSFATPIVTAAIAVIREAFPYMTSNQITALLFETARDLGQDGIDEVYGHGMLDLERATRPVGTPLVPVSETTTVVLNPARVSGVIGHQIKSKNIKFAFVDKYGRAFETNMNDNITIKNRGVGFERLQDNNETSIQFGKIEIGLRNSHVLAGTGFLATDTQNLISFVGVKNNLYLGNTELFWHTTLGTGNPTPSPESMINHFSDIYTASAAVGTKYKNWTFTVAIPETIVDGELNLKTPSGRKKDGHYTYQQHSINLTGKPAVEFSASYKFLTAGFVDNPYGTDEIYVFAKTKLNF